MEAFHHDGRASVLCLLQERLAEIEAEKAAKKLVAHQAAEQKLKEAAMPPRMHLAAQVIQLASTCIYQGNGACSHNSLMESSQCALHGFAYFASETFASFGLQIAQGSVSNTLQTALVKGNIQGHLVGNTASGRSLETGLIVLFAMYVEDCESETKMAV